MLAGVSGRAKASHVTVWEGTTTNPSVWEIDTASSEVEASWLMERFLEFPSQVTLHDRPQVFKGIKSILKCHHSKPPFGSVARSSHGFLYPDACGSSEGTEAERTCWTLGSFIENLVTQMILKLGDWVEGLHLRLERCHP